MNSAASRLSSSCRSFGRRRSYHVRTRATPSPSLRQAVAAVAGRIIKGNVSRPVNVFTTCQANPLTRGSTWLPPASVGSVRLRRAVKADDAW
jgi:hypothetical protein